MSEENIFHHMNTHFDIGKDPKECWSWPKVLYFCFNILELFYQSCVILSYLPFYVPTVGITQSGLKNYVFASVTLHCVCLSNSGWPASDFFNTNDPQTWPPIVPCLLISLCSSPICLHGQCGTRQSRSLRAADAHLLSHCSLSWLVKSLWELMEHQGLL